MISLRFSQTINEVVTVCEVVARGDRFAAECWLLARIKSVPTKIHRPIHAGVGDGLEYEPSAKPTGIVSRGQAQAVSLFSPLYCPSVIRLSLCHRSSRLGRISVTLPI